LAKKREVRFRSRRENQLKQERLMELYRPQYFLLLLRGVQLQRIAQLNDDDDWANFFYGHVYGHAYARGDHVSDDDESSSPGPNVQTKCGQQFYMT